MNPINSTAQLGLQDQMVGKAQAASHVSPKDAAKIHDLSQQFEGFFIYMTLQQMSQGLKGEDGIMGGGNAEKIWRSTLNEKMSEEISKNGNSGYGISSAIERQLLHLQEAKSHE